jgi:hypothetical protein
MNINIKKDFSEVSEKDLNINQEFFNLFQNELNNIYNKESVNNELNQSNYNDTIYNKQEKPNKIAKNLKKKKVKKEKKNQINQIDISDTNITKNNIIKIDEQDIFIIKLLINFFTNNL